jgi:hypothetical protein
MIPVLEQAFPDYPIVVRPHPTENRNVYEDIANHCRRIRVTNEGNVVPWLMAANVVIHNGCTTGVEAFVMRVPAVSYRKTVNDLYDDGFYRLPNRLSHQCFNFEELQTTLAQILRGELGAADGDERRALVDHFLVGLDGPLACERMVDILAGIAEELSLTAQPKLLLRLKGRYKASKRRVRKTCKTYLPGSFKSADFERHRYPGITASQIAERLARFQKELGDDDPLKLHQIYDKIFRINR